MQKSIKEINFKKFAKVNIETENESCNLDMDFDNIWPHILQKPIFAIQNG